MADLQNLVAQFLNSTETAAEQLNGAMTDTDWLNGSTNLLEEDHCMLTQPQMGRKVLVGVVGTTIAIICVVENVVLFKMLASRRQYRQSTSLYLIVLAFFDIFIGASYIALFSVNVYMDWWESVWLASTWYFYMVVMLTTSHVVMTSSVFLILAATFERYLATIRKSALLSFIQKNRPFVISLVLLFAFVSKFTVSLEVQTQPNENCTGVVAQRAAFSPFAFEEPYNTVFRFWYRNLVTVYLPFFMLLFFNYRIVFVLRRQERLSRLFRFGQSTKKSSARAASRALVLVVFTYLISNCLNIIITAWEFIDIDSLLHQRIRVFYSYSADFISVLVLLASALRLPIYLTCNPEIRATFCGRRTKHRMRKPAADSNFNGLPAPFRRVGGGETSSETTAPFGTGFDRMALAVVAMENDEARAARRRGDAIGKLQLSVLGKGMFTNNHEDKTAVEQDWIHEESLI